MSWAGMHRTINTIFIVVIALALFTVIDKLICTVEQEHTMPQCEQLLLDELRGE